MRSRSREIDVQLVALGYLRGPRGEWRHIPGLDLIARDALAAGVGMAWGLPADNRRGEALLWSRRIVLHERLFPCPGWVIRETIAHELGHIVTGRRSEDVARLWQARYGALVMPAWV